MIEDINPFHVFATAFMLIALFSIAMGILQKIYSIILAILAFPTYLGLYFIESWLPYKNSKGENVLSLHIPKKNPQKLFMNFAASVVTLCLLQFVYAILVSINTHTSQAKALTLIVEGKLTSTTNMIIFISSLIVIYIISYFFSEKDQDDAWTKMENLSLPSLWKIITKNIS